MPGGNPNHDEKGRFTDGPSGGGGDLKKLKFLGSGPITNEKLDPGKAFNDRQNRVNDAKRMFGPTIDSAPGGPEKERARAYGVERAKQYDKEVGNNPERYKAKGEMGSYHEHRAAYEHLATEANRIDSSKKMGAGPGYGSVPGGHEESAHDRSIREGMFQDRGTLSGRKLTKKEKAARHAKYFPPKGP